MIQRIQSLYLALVIILHVLLWFLPIWSGTSAADAAGNTVSAALMLSLSDFYGTESSPGFGEYYRWMSILNLAIVLLTALCIFWFKDRLRQLKLSRLLVIIECLFIALVFWSIEDAKTSLGPNASSNYLAGAFAPIVALILLFLAGQGILKDERLVRSADRLR